MRLQCRRPFPSAHRCNRSLNPIFPRSRDHDTAACKTLSHAQSYIFTHIDSALREVVNPSRYGRELSCDSHACNDAHCSRRRIFAIVLASAAGFVVSDSKFARAEEILCPDLLGRPLALCLRQARLDREAEGAYICKSPCFD
jgi:hypothetical protein